MDIIINPGESFSLSFGWDTIIALFAIAIPVFFITWYKQRKKAKPAKPKKLRIAIITLLATLLIYITLVAVVTAVMFIIAYN